MKARRRDHNSDISEDDNETNENEESENLTDVQKKKEKTKPIYNNEESVHNKQPLPTVKRRPPVHPTHKQESHFGKYLYIYIAAGVSLVAILIYMFYYSDSMFPVNNQDLPLFNLKSELLNLKKSYPNQNSQLWGTLSGCLSRMEEGYGNLCVLLLLHRHNSDAFSLLLEDVGQLSKKSLKTHQNPVIVKGDHLKTILLKNNPRHHYDNIASYYHRSFNESKVFIVNGLESVPGQILKQFHSLCDEQNPAVNGMSIFLTLKSELLVAGTSVRKIAEKTFSQLWSSIPKNELNPIITRMTVNVAELKPN